MVVVYFKGVVGEHHHDNNCSNSYHFVILELFLGEEVIFCGKSVGSVWLQNSN